MRFVAVFADGTATLTQIIGEGILADADSITESVHSPNVPWKSTGLVKLFHPYGVRFRISLFVFLCILFIYL